MNVTRLISFKVVSPARIFAMEDWRRVVMPSAMAAFRISDGGRLSSIIYLTWSERSRNSVMAFLPRNPV